MLSVARSPLRRHTLSLFCAAVLLATTMLAATPQAEISTSQKASSKSVSSFGGASTATDAEYTAVLEQYTILLEKIRTNKAAATEMQAARDAASPTYNASAHVTLLEDIARDEATADTFYTWLSGQADSSKDTGKNNGKSNSGNKGNDSGSGGGMQDMLKGMATNMAQQLLSGGGAGGFGGLGNVGGGNLGGGGVANPGSTNSGSAGAGGDGTTTTSAAAGQDADKAAADKATADKAAAEREEKKKKAKCSASTAKSKTESNPGKAKDDIVTPSFSSPYTVQSGTPESTATTDANPGKAQDDECTASDYTTPTPTSAQGAKPGAVDTVEEMEAKKNTFVGPTQECASLVQSLNPDLGLTRTWRKGDPVKGNKNIAVGTPLATFNFTGSEFTPGSGDRYTPPNTGGISGKSHTVLYVDQDPVKGLKVFHQYNGTKSHFTWIPWDSWSGGSAEAGNQYHTIVTGGTSWNRLIPILQPVWMALKLEPFDGGLSNVQNYAYTS